MSQYEALARSGVPARRPVHLTDGRWFKSRAWLVHCGCVFVRGIEWEALNASSLTCSQKTWTNQGEHQSDDSHTLHGNPGDAALRGLSFIGANEVEPSGVDAHERGVALPWALHQPWRRAPPASNPLVRLKEPAPLSLRHWDPGRKARPRAKSTCCCKGARTRTNIAASTRCWNRTSEAPKGVRG